MRLRDGEGKMKATFNDQTNALDITHNGETRSFPCFATGYNSDILISCRVFAGKYRTGAKVWPVSVQLDKRTGQLSTMAAGYGRGGRCAGVATLVGWWADMASELRSQA